MSQKRSLQELRLSFSGLISTVSQSLEEYKDSFDPDYVIEWLSILEKAQQVLLRSKIDAVSYSELAKAYNELEEIMFIISDRLYKLSCHS